jgi:hypothetical protein
MSWTEYLGEDGIAKASMCHGIFCSRKDTIRRDASGETVFKSVNQQKRDECDGGSQVYQQKQSVAALKTTARAAVLGIS